MDNFENILLNTLHVFVYLWILSPFLDLIIKYIKKIKNK